MPEKGPLVTEMRKAEKSFRRYALLAVSVLLAVLLLVINAVNFTMLSEDADEITQRIADSKGEAGKKEDRESLIRWRLKSENGPRPMGPMGPDSPELFSSVRYFTVALPKGEDAELVAFQISAVTEEEAVSWAESLKKESTGWTRGTYRYRVYQEKDVTYVTVIDEGRELLSCYRLLVISGVGFLLCVLVVWLVLRYVGERLFAPLAEADRRQRKFIARVEQSFKLPLKLIERETESMERQYGPGEESRAIRREIRGMSELVADLGNLAVFAEEDLRLKPFSLSEALETAAKARETAFRERGIRLSLEIPAPVELDADPEAMGQVAEELLANALNYAKSWAAFRLTREGERVTLTAENDAELPDGSVDQVFDRYTTLSNHGAGAGLGLSHVKEIIRAHHGRVSARVEEGVFRLRITL